jgi:hypothetical protein
VAHDDWRLRVEIEDRPDTLLERLGVEVSDEARDLASELKQHRLVVSREDDTVFVYAASRAEAERAAAVVRDELFDLGLASEELKIEHWLPDEDRWDDEPAGLTVEEELIAHGVAPWEVRVQCGRHEDARELADRLEAEGYGVVRRWKYLLVGTETREEAEALAGRLHGEVEPGSGVVWDVAPPNPFVIFGGLGT